MEVIVFDMMLFIGSGTLSHPLTTFEILAAVAIDLW